MGHRHACMHKALRKLDNHSWPASLKAASDLRTIPAREGLQDNPRKSKIICGHFDSARRERSWGQS